MKIKRFFAADMRQAIRDVREEQGPEAVILSNRHIDGGVEIIAAIDYDASLISQAAGPAAGVERPAAEPAQKPSPPVEKKPAPSATVNVHTVRDDPALVGMRRELSGLRRLFEGQLASLAWNDMARREPMRADVLRELAELGLTPAIARKLIADLPPSMTRKQAWRVPLAVLAKRLPLAGGTLLDRGGVVAMVGPTGVGKTTTIAKLAARFALRHGRRDVALITTDGFRIGAQEQLFTFGRILGVPVYVANDAAELIDVLGRVDDKRLVLIDTAGVSHRDVRLAEQFRTLSPRGGAIETCLVLAANAEPANLDEVARAYAPLKPRYCVATKLDEAASLGGVLSAAIAHRLPLAYVSDGQRVPEDIRPASAHKLVCEAVKCVRTSPRKPDEGTMAQRFGTAAVAYA